MTKTVENNAPRKNWKKPELRSAVPAAHTRGGAGGFQPNPPLDDIFYDAS
ncbi:hypothetical protein [Sphingopyxis sp. KK2]|nr:hypothetical protein [Sphingopyxis sp. KK2]